MFQGKLELHCASVVKMGFIILLLCIPTLFSVAYTDQYVNVQQQNELYNSVSQLFYSIDEREGEIAEPILSRRQIGKPLYSFNLKLAAFNVQTFGIKKMSTSGVPEILVKIILRYDVILIQEIRDNSGKAIKDLLSLINKASSSQYIITISPRLGRSSSKEQYAFLYRKDILSVKHSYVYDDGKESLKKDTFEREPFIAHFTSTLTKITDFVLVAIHTSPSKAPEEINELASVYDDVIKKLSIRDVVILGDLNAACSYMSDSDWRENRLANDTRFHWLISDCVDTTVAGGHCAYDRFVVAGEAMLEAVVESSAEVYEYDQVLRINKTMAKRVSDHYPIEIQLYSEEMATAVSNIHKTVEYTFMMKQPHSLDKRTIYRMKKTFNASGFTEKRTYNKGGAISGVTFSKSFGNKAQAVDAILDIKNKAEPKNMISLDQIQMAEFQTKGAWDKNEKLSVSRPGVVKLVCDIYPSTNCWIAIVYG